jgi:hypothetical protein
MLILAQMGLLPAPWGIALTASLVYSASGWSRCCLLLLLRLPLLPLPLALVVVTCPGGRESAPF